MIRASVAIIERNGRILIARRLKNDPLQGKWEFPGGKIEEGETPEDCLKRELREELGADVRITGLLHTGTHQYPHGLVTVSFYCAELLSDATAGREYSELRWVPPEELSRYDVPDANREIIGLLQRLNS